MGRFGGRKLKPIFAFQLAVKQTWNLPCTKINMLAATPCPMH